MKPGVDGRVRTPTYRSYCNFLILPKLKGKEVLKVQKKFCHKSSVFDNWTPHSSGGGYAPAFNPFLVHFVGYLIYSLLICNGTGGGGGGVKGGGAIAPTFPPYHTIILPYFAKECFFVMQLSWQLPPLFPLTIL